jgi:membrane protease YdiL (CAAX protease family)
MGKSGFRNPAVTEFLGKNEIHLVRLEFWTNAQRGDSLGAGLRIVWVLEFLPRFAGRNFAISGVLSIFLGEFTKIEFTSSASSFKDSLTLQSLVERGNRIHEDGIHPILGFLLFLPAQPSVCEAFFTRL